LNEGGAPFRFQLGANGEPKSVGFDTQLGSHEDPVSAHPKFDFLTGETFFHGKTMAMPPSFFVARCKDGKVLERTSLPMMRQGFQHDMFFTENYICVIDGSLLFKPKSLVKGGPLWKFNPESKLRFGILPRSGELSADNFIWIDAPVAGEIIHTLNAYDENGKIILWSPLGQLGVGQQDPILGGMGPIHMHRLVIDVNKRCMESFEKAPGGESFRVEFPRCRDDRYGQRLRYGYSGVQSPGPDFNFTGVLKWDMEDFEGSPTLISYPEGVVGGEPIFLPRTGSTSVSDVRGDDGYIGVFLWNAVREESTFAIYDARTFSSIPVAELSFPMRVPMGFHAGFITEEGFQKQLQMSS
jgi:carotenoid cleavage dioxygenase